jgi:macrolide transport system ATP-binding/permease protein
VATSALIDIESVSKTIPGRASEMALRGATVRIGRGEFVSIVGPSGSGKTTLLSILGLLERPSAGTYRFDGVDVSTLSETQRNRFRGERVGFVFQNSFVVAEETVASNVALGLAVRGVERRERRRRVIAALERVGLGDFLDKPAGDLSGGEKQRVALARALVTEPDVILADEPTGSLDAESTNRLVTTLREINAGGTTVVVVTHDPVIAQAADRRIELVDGVCVEGDSPVVAGAEPNATGRPQGNQRVRYGQELADAVFAPLTRPGRSALVLVAYVLGVMALVGAVGLTQSATGRVVTRLTAAGSNELRVFMDSQDAGSLFFDPANPAGGAARLAGLAGVEVAVPVVTYAPSQNAVTRLPAPGLPSFSGRLVVTDARYLAAHHLVAESGRVDLLANSWDGAVVAVGAVAARDFGIPAAGPLERLWVNGRPVDVVATLATSGDVLADNALYFSRGASSLLAGLADKYLLVHTEPGYAEPLARAIPLALAPDNPGAVTVSVVAQLAQLQQGIDSDLSHLLSVIGWVILVLSALTAGTSMFLSIQHRAPEIALRRALGAPRASIWRLFTWEGTAIGCAGGILGTVLGAALTWAVTAGQGSEPCLGLRVIAIGLGLGLLAGMVASAYPALYASHRDPAQILRTV